MRESEDLRSRLGKDAPFMTKVDFFFNRKRSALYCEMLLMLIGAMIITFIPFLIGKWMDRYTQLNVGAIDFTLENTAPLMALIIATTAVWYILVTSGRSRYVRNIAMNKLRKNILAKIDRKDINYVETRSPGRYVEYISNEQQNLSRMFNSDVVSVVEGLFVFGVIIVLMLFTNIFLALLYIILLPLTYFAIRHLVRKMKTDVKSRQKSFVKMNSYLDDVSSNYSLIKMYGLEKHMLDDFTEIDTKLSREYRHVLYTSGAVAPLERIVENLGFIISGIVGVILLNSELITAGMFLTFVSYASMMGKPLSNFADGLGRLRDSSVSMQRVCKFLTSDEDERHGDADAGTSDGDIGFRDVSYSVVSGKKILDSVSLDIRHGEHIAMIGASGSGKSSIIDMMVALQSADSGSVLYGGKDVFEYEKNSLRRSISVIPSIPWVLSGTVMENIRVVAPDASEEEIMKACRTIGFDRSVERMENGFDTSVGSGSGNMSLAEKQMLSLVRLLLTDPKVVIFDDSFSGMDALTVLKIKEKMADFLKDRTVITVSDDIIDMMAADRILYVSECSISSGSHKELSSIPEYAKMVNNVL